MVRANVNLPFRRHSFVAQFNTTGKCQKWMYNEAVLETLIGWIFFFLLLLLFFLFFFYYCGVFLLFLGILFSQ